MERGEGYLAEVGVEYRLQVGVVVVEEEEERRLVMAAFVQDQEGEEEVVKLWEE